MEEITKQTKTRIKNKTKQKRGKGVFKNQI